jgi:hypothetical protein
LPSARNGDILVHVDGEQPRFLAQAPQQPIQQRVPTGILVQRDGSREIDERSRHLERRIVLRRNSAFVTEQRRGLAARPKRHELRRHLRLDERAGGRAKPVEVRGACELDATH